MNLGRNDPCHCGSGKKYKKCCLGKSEEARHATAAERATLASPTSGPPDQSARRIPTLRPAMRA